MTDKDRLIARVRKLLKLSASANEHEAAAAAAKAHALLAEHNLDMADVGADDEQQTATTARAKTRQRLEPWAHRLGNATAEAFDCQYYHSSYGVTSFVGVGADAEVCAWTYGYLYRALLRMASTYMRKRGARMRLASSKRAARESYLAGAVVIVARRLLDQKRQAPITSDALVPVKDAAIKAAMPDDVQEKKIKDRSFRSEDMLAGAMAAHNLPLSTPVNGQAATAIQ